MLEIEATVLVWVKGDIKQASIFSDQHWSKQLESTSEIGQQTWKFAMDFESLEGFSEYQTAFAEQILTIETECEIAIDVGVFLEMGYTSRSVSLLPVLSAAIAERRVPFQFSMYECESERCS